MQVNLVFSIKHWEKAMHTLIIYGSWHEGKNILKDVDSQEVWEFSFCFFSSTIVRVLLSAALLSYPDLLYLFKDTEPAAALVLKKIMELESTWAMSETRKWSKAEKRSNLGTKWFGAVIQSMGNNAPVSYFSSAPGPQANVLHYRTVLKEKLCQTMK